MTKAKNRSDELTTSLLVGGQALDDLTYLLYHLENHCTLAKRHIQGLGFRAVLAENGNRRVDLTRAWRKEAQRGPLPLESRARATTHSAHGYPAHLIPDIWVGQNVAMNTLGGGSLVLANGTLEAVTPEGFVLSNDVRSDRLYTEGSRRTIGAVRSEPERYRCRFLRPALERLRKNYSIHLSRPRFLSSSRLTCSLENANLPSRKRKRSCSSS